jgi:hypothetical protein
MTTFQDDNYNKTELTPWAGQEKVIIKYRVNVRD